MRKFLNSQLAPWGVLDTWQNRGQPLGVFTVLADHAHGKGWLTEVKGDHQGVWGLAVVDQAADKPTERLREALDQSKRREEKKLAFSTQPIQVWSVPHATPSRAAATADERDIGEPLNFKENHQPQMRPVPRYAQDRHGPGRWVRMYRGGHLIGTLWTDDAQGLGLIPESGESVTLLVNSIGSACALGTPTSWVFDDHAAWAAQEHWAGPVETGDLATLGSGGGSAP
jgi:hypothetical protein